ncbi:TonB-dependent receptor [Flavobacteriaceae bacterium Ap0902]|nr:TonB-dependent receptor [Flavobacteriaceae bacterium Ap0902]
MHFRSMLVLLFVGVFGMLQGQEDSTIIQLSKIKVKAINPEKSIYKAEEIDALTQQVNTGKDLAHQLESLSGVQVRKSGSNISKPIIDGLSSSRLVYMVYGVKLENQDWADAHSPEIDPDLANDLSVLRGAETVTYGSNALGGVIQINAGKIPSDSIINGAATIHYDGNTGGWGGRLKVQQQSNLLKGLRWRLSANNTQHGDYKTAAYNIGNSGTRLESYRGELEYKYKNLAIRTFYSDYSAKQGNYFGALTGNIEEFKERIELGRPLNIIPYSFKVRPPHQQSRHQIMNVSTRWKFSPNWYVNGQYSYQKNHKQEFDVRRSGNHTIPVQDMHLESEHYNAEIGYQTYRIQSIIGLQIRDKEHYNQPGTGVTPVLPNYIFKEKSIYTQHTYQSNDWTWNAGIRYDWAKFNARGYNFLGQEYGENKEFSAFSAQLATDYAKKHWQVNSSLSYGWRVPEAYELYANGKQHGIPIYFVGNSNLKAEKGWKWMNSIQFQTGKSRLEIQGFINLLENYIYAVPTHIFKQLFSGPAAIFQFKQQDALIYGFDIIHLTQILDNLELTNKLSWIKGKEINSENPLPNISPLRIHNHLQINLPSYLIFKSNEMQIGHDWIAQKQNYNPAYELSTQIPEAYHLFNLAWSTKYPIADAKNLQFSLGVDNFFNTLYKDYLNLHRYFVHDRGRSIYMNIQFQF